MDPMFPSQGNPPAPMLRDIRGSAKRAINFFWIVPGELAMDGEGGRIFAEVFGTETYDPVAYRDHVVSYDVISASTPNFFEDEHEERRWDETVTFLADRHGLVIDPRSWHVIEDVICAAVFRA